MSFLAFDNAIDPEAARIKGIHSPVAGRAQILVVPDLEAGNMLAKNLVYLSKADSPGWYLVRACPLCLHRVPTPFAAAWRRVPPPCFMLRRVANPQASQPREPHGRDPVGQCGLLECQVSDL